ncbi:MAG: hypothetical protein HS104_39375 [Polyangiaceae bacterium]|nr:hypothetical protein [Polyangiaceae bacterium]MCL4756274.1 hypothetical protein [Myxococcales bacterium]
MPWARVTGRALAASLVLRAAAVAAAPATEVPRDHGVVGPVLPERWEVEPRRHWVVGITTESAAQRVASDEVISALFVGLSAGLRWEWANPHLRLMAGDRGVNARYFAGLGFRTFFGTLWGTEWSCGVGTHFDARLARHYWLVGVTPLELGVTLFDQRSWSIQMFWGARAAVAGRLLNSYLIDPNGFHNAAAQDELEDARDHRPWEGFVSVVFGRKVE